MQKENLKSKTKQFWLKKAYFGLITWKENKKIGNFASDKFFEDVIIYINNYINISIWYWMSTISSRYILLFF